jgi:streptomycin 6-kinase
LTAEQEERQAWRAARPEVIRQARERWSLTTGEPFQPAGQTAWVAPARDGAGADLVLKVAWPHPEAAHEADGLRAWAGYGAVRLHATHDFGPARALLLERCRPGTELSARPEPEQDTVIATLLHRLWIQPGPGHPFASLDQMCQRWADRSERILAAGQQPAAAGQQPAAVGRQPAAGPQPAAAGHQPAAAGPHQPALAALDPGLVRAGLALFRELPATADRQVLLATDLHAGNVLAAAREPWLVIDPKPHVGDPAYDSLQHMLNCDDRLRSDPRGLARRMAGLLGLDPDRVLRWLFARCVQESADCPALAEVARRIAP